MDKGTQEAKQLNAKARQNSTASGASKISLTNSSTNSTGSINTNPSMNVGSFSNGTDSGLEEARKLNQQSASGNTGSLSSSSNNSALEEAKKLNQQAKASKSSPFSG